MKTDFKNIVFIVSSIFILFCVAIGIAAPAAFENVSNTLFSHTC